MQVNRFSKRACFVAAALLILAAPAGAEEKSLALETELGTFADTDMATTSEKASAFFNAHFAAEPSQCSEPGNPNLTFDQVCQWYGDPDSTWPDMMIGVEADQITSVATLNAKAYGAGWQCAQRPAGVELDFCYAASVSQADRDRWTAEWQAYINSAN